MDNATGITTRRSVRYEIVLPACLAVAPQHAEMVRFIDPDKIRGVPSDLIDIGLGGLALMSPGFFPRMSILDVQIFGCAGRDARPILSARARVQRITMTDCRPGYLIGALFIERTPRFQRELDAVLCAAEGDASSAELSFHCGTQKGNA